ncbi:hypothetical protein GJ496_006959 [Pomphorhynchus laevis]|nr:hypothetical protein GJ496_006959 [Pomphorhynchus laevis]
MNFKPKKQSLKREYSSHETENISPVCKRVRKNEEITVEFLDQQLWAEFNLFTNEMIVTKNGRRMFPILRTKLQGLQPESMYKISLRFKCADGHRWRFVNGEWQHGQKSNLANDTQQLLYQHPYSPNFGSFWMNQPICFSKLRLTNRGVANDYEKVTLNSLHRYVPELVITKVEGNTEQHISAVEFPLAEFIAVTAYQNERVTALKIQHNPFAKAFLDVNDRHQHQERILIGRKRRRIEEQNFIPLDASTPTMAYGNYPHFWNNYVNFNNQSEENHFNQAVNCVPMSNEQNTMGYPHQINPLNDRSSVINAPIFHHGNSYVDSCYSSTILDQDPSRSLCKNGGNVIFQASAAVLQPIPSTYCQYDHYQSRHGNEAPLQHQ